MAGVEYEPIDHDTQTFRLIQIEGLSNSGHPICRMRNALVHEATYYALSYTWESPDDQKPIIVNGQQILVRANLEAFLRNACNLFEGVWIWIDALCINQENTEERNHQVRQMGFIYAEARRVIVWLGPDSANLSDLFWRLDQDNDTILEYDRALLEVIFTDILELDKNPYWRRMWVVPELLLARSIRLVHGDEVIGWDRFWRRVDFFIFFARLRGVMQGDELNRLVISDHRRHKNNPQRSWLLADLLRTYATFKCADKRDRVFALLPLFDNGDMAVDYSDSTETQALRLWLHLNHRKLHCPPLLILLQSLVQHETLTKRNYRRYIADLELRDDLFSTGKMPDFIALEMGSGSSYIRQMLLLSWWAPQTIRKMAVKDVHTTGITVSSNTLSGARHDDKDVPRLYPRPDSIMSSHQLLELFFIMVKYLEPGITSIRPPRYSQDNYDDLLSSLDARNQRSVERQDEVSCICDWGESQDICAFLGINDQYMSLCSPSWYFQRLGPSHYEVEVEVGVTTMFNSERLRITMRVSFELPDSRHNQESMWRY